MAQDGERVDEANAAVLAKRLGEISACICASDDVSLDAGLECFSKLMQELGMRECLVLSQSEIDILVSSVNLQRLGNFPIELSRDAVERIYNTV